MSGGRGRRPRPVLTAAVVVASAAVVPSYLLPWARSGQVGRSAFALARTVELLGLAEGPGRRALLVAFWLSPLLAGGTSAAAVLGRSRLAGTLSMVTGAVAMAAAAVVVRAPRVEPAVGLAVGIVLGAGAIVMGAWLVATASRERDRGEP